MPFKMQPIFNLLTTFICMLVLSIYIKTLQGTFDSIKVIVLINFFTYREIHVYIYIPQVF